MGTPAVVKEAGCMICRSALASGPSTHLGGLAGFLKLVGDLPGTSQALEDKAAEGRVPSFRSNAYLRSLRS